MRTARLFALVSLLFLFLSPYQVLAEAKDPALIFEQATEQYIQGNFSEAVRLYEELSTTGLSFQLLYNLGNSYAQDSRPGMAILSYIRALRLSPSDSDTLGNLQLIRKEHGLFQPERSFLQQIVHLLEMNQWCLAAGIIFVLFSLFHLGCFFFPPLQKARTWVSILLGCAILLGCFSCYYRYLDFHDGVVTAKDSHLRISPFVAASSVGALQEGRVIRPMKTHGEFTLVKDSTGRTGWLHRDQFALIVEK